MNVNKSVKIFVFSLCAMAFLPFSAVQADDGNLPALRRALEDMQQQYGHEVPQVQAFLERLKNLEDAAEAGKGEEVLAEAAAVLRREALLSHPALDFDEVLVVKRGVQRMGLPQNWQGNCSLPRDGYDNEIALLHLDRTGAAVTNPTKIVYRPGLDVFVGDLCLHWEGGRLLFSSMDEARRWHVYEMAVDGSGLQRITPDTHDDVDYYDACYLPDDRILLGATAAYTAVPCVYGSDHVANLFLLDPAEGTMRQLCFDQDHNWTPRILPNGRVLYQRWEYSDTPHSNTRMLFHMNPDGTDQREFWGSGVYFPNSFFYARPVPGTNGQVVGVATGHHGTTRSGRLFLITPELGRDEAEGIVQEIPGWGKQVEPQVRDRLVDGVWPQFLHPYPISDKHFLVSAKLRPEGAWGIYLVDLFDNITLLAEAEGYALLEPIPLRQEPRPPVVPDRVNLARNDGVMLMQDVYEGGGLEGVPRGEVAALRVFQYYFGLRGQGGLHGTLGNDAGWDIKRVLGTVPVAADGSVYFKAPANTALAVQPLDQDGQALQIMRSWFTLQPGEQASCVGCHESQRTAPPTMRAEAFLRPPVEIIPAWHAPQRGFSFAREVQPVLDRYCGGCHGEEPPEGLQIAPGREFPYLRGDKMIGDWSTQISGGVGPDMGGVFSESYAALQRFVRRPGIESDIRMLTPMDFHFSTTELGQLLRKGHHNAPMDRESWERLVVWFDLNAPYHGTWTESHPRQIEHAPRVAERARQLRREFVPMGPTMDLEYVPSLPAYDNAFIEPEPVEAKDIPPEAVEGWPFVTDEAVRLQAKMVQARNLVEDGSLMLELGGGVKMELVGIPGGAFPMGSRDGHPDESPVTPVDVGDFLMGRYEVTNEQFRRFNPQHESRDESRHGYQFGRRGFFMDDPKQPVVRVSWEEAQAFCDWLSDESGLQVSLPTEAQWEWAARAGSDEAFYFGAVDADYSTYANLADRKLQEFAQCTARDNYELAEPIANPNRHDDRIPRCDRFDDGAMISVEVGRYAPNAWGLHDMHGNAWEWTRSAYSPYPYADLDGRNDVATPVTERTVRGGSWRDRPHRATASFRLPYRPYQKVFNVGFRVIVELDREVSTDRIAAVSRGAQ